MDTTNVEFEKVGLRSTISLLILLTLSEINNALF